MTAEVIHRAGSCDPGVHKNVRAVEPNADTQFDIVITQEDGGKLLVNSDYYSVLVRR